MPPGNRVSKAVTTGGTTTTIHYLRDASGNVMAIYKDTQLAEQPIYGSSRLGQYTGRPEPGTRIWQRKKYELSNHLGNVLAVVGDGHTTTAGDKEAWISSLQDYYPFGLAMEGRSSNLGDYRYGFQGQEEDYETDYVNYKYRMHDPRIARFFAVDPLTSKYPSYNSPYAFSENRVIDGIELEGLEVVLIGGNINGSYAVSGGVEGGLAIAPEGIYLYGSYEYGAESDINLSLTGSVTVFPDLPSADYLKGSGSSIGFAAGEGIVGSTSDVESGGYKGTNFQVGVGIKHCSWEV